MAVDLNHVFRSGKYAGKTVNYVYSVDRRYFNWVAENRPEMLKSHKGKPKPVSNKKPTYVDPPDLSDAERGVIKPASIDEAFDL